MIIHSEKDYRLPITEGIAVFNVLQEKGVPSRLLVFPDENHWVLKPENGLMWHREVLKWIDEWSGLGEEKVKVEDQPQQEDEDEQQGVRETDDARRLKKLAAAPVGTSKRPEFGQVAFAGEPLDSGSQEL